MKQSTQKIVSEAQEVKNPKEIGSLSDQEGGLMMRGLLVVGMVALGVLVAGSAVAGDSAAGKTVYDSAKPACKGCHTDTKFPLAKVGAAYKEDELKAWVRTPKDMFTKHGKKGVMPAYPAEKISDADLANLVAYLASMK
jgi:mono/diheme cytochrome c family protein